MSRNSYRSFLRLLEKWPIDTSKSGGRDLGEHLRHQVTNAFKQGDATVVNENECQRIHSSLERLALNVHGNKFPRKLQSSSTGLSLDQCREISSTEFIETVQEEEAPLYSKVFKRKK
ncbi:ubiquinol-cytochrome-c reductase complex assembly factor 2-like [Macrobrachium nipponense]|uniref:ubiquinol-cytochrome-c reductase complex assembly factor 2-like n=1 Tax=Macrobrachium nipponense TaxID=159736 RepID=UPI0030C7D7D8